MSSTGLTGNALHPIAIHFSSVPFIHSKLNDAQKSHVECKMLGEDFIVSTEINASQHCAGSQTAIERPKFSSMGFVEVYLPNNEGTPVSGIHVPIAGQTFQLIVSPLDLCFRKLRF